jgi:hypothetical protein
VLRDRSLITFVHSRRCAIHHYRGAGASAFAETHPGKVLDLNGQADSKRLVAFGRLPMDARFPPGDYLLQVVVTDAPAKEKNRIATQWIDFEIR